jgi:ribose transport system ATP-binding protein
VDLNVAVSTLAPADRARVAMARALQGSEPGRGLIIFDESTKALQPEALDEFYATVRALVDQGTSVLLISHRLDEVVERADRVTILRDGRVMHGGVRTATMSEAELASRMLGKTLDDVPRPAPRATAKPAVRIEGARLSPQEPLLDLAIGRGEIVGVTGLAGSGFEALPYVLAGARPAPEGRLSIGDRTFDLSRPRIGARIRNGIVLVPERRVPDGVSIAHDIQDNVTLPRVDVRGRKWFIGNAWQRAEAGEAIDLLGVTPRDRRAVVGNLSGGNQQKVLLGRWLVSAPNLLLLHEPTQAVDVQARSDILTSIVRAAEGGCCVLLASSEAADLVAICDRICLMRGGTVVEETPGGVATEHVLNKIYGGGVDAPAGDGPAVPVAPKEAV